MPDFWIFRRASHADFAENTRFYKGVGQTGLFFRPARFARRDGSKSDNRSFYSEMFSTINSGRRQIKTFWSFLFRKFLCFQHGFHRKKKLFKKKNFIIKHPVYELFSLRTEKVRTKKVRTPFRQGF